MVSTVTVFPRLPSPPENPDVRYLSDLVRALEVVIAQLQNAGPERGTAQTLTALQYGNDVGLEKGALYVTNCINTNSRGNRSSFVRKLLKTTRLCIKKDVQ